MTTITASAVRAFVRAAYARGLAAHERCAHRDSIYASALAEEWGSHKAQALPDLRPEYQLPRWQDPSGDHSPSSLELQTRVECAHRIGLAVVTARHLKRREAGPPPCPPGAFVMEALAPVVVEALCATALHVKCTGIAVVAEAHRHFGPLCKVLNARAASMCEAYFSKLPLDAYAAELSTS